MILKKQFKKDKFVVTHGEEALDILKENARLKEDPQQGWTRDRNEQMVGKIAPTQWFAWCQQYPELMYGDKKLRDKTLAALLNTHTEWKTIKGNA